MPLVLMTCAAGLVGSLSLSFIKGLTESFRQSGLGSSSVWMYMGIALACGGLQLKFINKSMELYDQVETIPIYQSSLILMNICAGTIVMQESRLYTVDEFIPIIFFGLISISGVWLIIKKPNTKNTGIKSSPKANLFSFRHARVKLLN